MNGVRRRRPIDDALEGISASLLDLRFRKLVGDAAWWSLPAAVRHRFSKRLHPGASVTYRGEILACRINKAGWLVAQLCRLIGSPLPLGKEIGLAAVVTVTEDARSGGQVWSRIYARRSGFPQVIHSAKRFAGPTGLEEYLGCGVGIALATSADPSGIHFASDHYFLRLGFGSRLRFPAWLAPGALRIDHVDRSEGGFEFALTLRHRLFGELIHQMGRFRDQPVGEWEPGERADRCHFS